MLPRPPHRCARCIRPPEQTGRSSPRTRSRAVCVALLPRARQRRPGHPGVVAAAVPAGARRKGAAAGYPQTARARRPCPLRPARPVVLNLAESKRGSREPATCVCSHHSSSRQLRGGPALHGPAPEPLRPAPAAQLHCTFLDVATNMCRVHEARPVQVGTGHWGDDLE